MAPPTKNPTPKFFVRDEYKENMIEQMVAQTIYSLNRLSNDGRGASGDDFLDLFSRAIAAKLASDTNLNTEDKLREGVEAAIVHISGHMRRYLAERKKTGVSALDRMIAAHEIPEEMKRAWNDS